MRLEPADSALLRVRAADWCLRAAGPRATSSFFTTTTGLAHGGASPDEDAHDAIFGFFVRLFAVERLSPLCRVVVLRLSV